MQGFQRETPDSGVDMADFDLTRFLFDNNNPVDWDSIIVPMDHETLQTQQQPQVTQPVSSPVMFVPQQQQSGIMTIPQNTLTSEATMAGSLLTQIVQPRYEWNLSW